MSPSESTPMDRLRLLAQISGSREISLDVEEIQEVSKGQQEVREQLERMQRDLQLLSSVA